MKVLSLFDGISCGQIALERAGMPVEVYYASEIDRYAISVTQKHYPNTVQLGDVSQIDFKHIEGEIDLLIGGSPCFVAGTKIKTDEGYKNIEDIKVGDKVLTHTNSFKEVVNIGSTNNKEIYSFKAQGGLRTLVTENHPYYACKSRKKWNKTKKRYEKVLDAPEWTPVRTLKKGDYVGVPIPQTKNNKYNLDKEDCWLLGRYLADGHLRHSKRKGRKNSYQYGVIYSIGDKKVEDFKKHLNKYHASIYLHSKSTYRCCINSKNLVEFIKNRGFGQGAINKQIPQFILDLPIDLAEEFLKGYISGDGCISNTGKIQASSISINLVLSLQLLIAKVYKISSNIIFRKCDNKRFIENRLVNQHDIYSISYKLNAIRKTHVDIKNGIIWYPVKEIEKTNRNYQQCWA